MPVVIQVLIRVGAMIIGILAITKISEKLAEREVRKAENIKTTRTEAAKNAFKAKGWTVH
jgi:hypothetical protein